MIGQLSFLVQTARSLESAKRPGIESERIKAKDELVGYCVEYLAHEAHKHITDDERSLSRATDSVFAAVSEILDAHLPKGPEGFHKRIRILALAKAFDPRDRTEIRTYIAALNATEPKEKFSEHDALALIKKLGLLRDNIEEFLSDTFPILASRRLDEEPAPPSSQQSTRGLPKRGAARGSRTAAPYRVTKPAPKKHLPPSSSVTSPLSRKKPTATFDILADNSKSGQVRVNTSVGKGGARRGIYDLSNGFFAAVAASCGAEEDEDVEGEAAESAMETGSETE